jgi:DNA-binding MarR family transcriptional regulator
MTTDQAKSLARQPFSEQTGYLLIEVGQLAKDVAAQAVAPLGLRPRHVSVLAVLAGGDHLRSQQEVSRSLGIDPNVLVGLIDDLERLGLAERKRNPSDRRRHMLMITGAGTGALRSARKLLDDTEAAFLRVLEPGEKAALHDMLARLLSVTAGGDEGTGCASDLPHCPQASRMQTGVGVVTSVPAGVSAPVARSIANMDTEPSCVFAV